MEYQYQPSSSPRMNHSNKTPQLPAVTARSLFEMEEQLRRARALIEQQETNSSPSERCPVPASTDRNGYRDRSYGRPTSSSRIGEARAARSRGEEDGTSSGDNRRRRSVEKKSSQRSTRFEGISSFAPHPQGLSVSPLRFALDFVSLDCSLHKLSLIGA